VIDEPVDLEASVLGSPRIAGRSIPRGRSGVLVTVPNFATRASRELPLPPPELWAVEADHLDTGERDARTITRLCAAQGLDLSGPRRVLDFGCGTGRVLRHLVRTTDEGGEVWGADLDSRRVDWCRANLTPPFRFVTLNTAPHLPFEDGFFDLVIGGSVFTHIPDQDDAWLLELRRVTRPGGLLCLSILDRNVIDEVLAQPGSTPYKDWFGPQVETPHDLDAAFREGAARLGEDVGMFAIDDPNSLPNVFHDRAFLERHWGSLFEWLAIEDAAWFRQSVVVLRKRS
jgi:SAM-dependent methyltransferase